MLKRRAILFGVTITYLFISLFYKSEGEIDSLSDLTVIQQNANIIKKNTTYPS